jgi:hypothetical protein
MKKYISLAIILFVSAHAFAQVNDIKRSSAGKSGGSEGRGGSGGVGAAYFLINFAVRGLVPWQINTLHKRGEVPNVLSLEVYGQVAIQPSTYYIFNPRVRGNWGILLTDFRMNYMIEDKLGGPVDLRTDDWQILGLNVINTRMVTARISTGIMHEAFGDGNIYSESAIGLSVMRPDQKIGGMGEFRWSRDYTYNTTPRLEASLGVQRKLFDRKAIHMFATGGVMFQRYYSSINVWGMQAGLAFKLY